jgi:hypothetical protein
VPKHGANYADSVFSRCRDLIRYGVWSGLNTSRLDLWINNFRQPRENYFAARVLDSLIYRSEEQTIALLRQLLERVIPDLARINGLPQCLQRVGNQLGNSRIDPRVRIVPVFPDKADTTPSGPVIARLLRRTQKVNKKWIIYPNDLETHLSQIDAVVLFDDFLGTGTQFKTFFSSSRLLERLGDKSIVFGCLAAHQQGIQTLRQELPHVHVAAVEQLDSRHSLFHPTGQVFPDGENSPEAAREFYLELLQRYQIRAAAGLSRGYGELEIVYAFAHNVPNNSLPILWWSRSSQWKPLFDR